MTHSPESKRLSFGLDGTGTRQNRMSVVSIIKESMVDFRQLGCKCCYVVDKNGQMIDGSRVSTMNKMAHSIWAALMNTRKAHTKWSLAEIVIEQVTDERCGYIFLDFDSERMTGRWIQLPQITTHLDTPTVQIITWSNRRILKALAFHDLYHLP